MKTTTMKSKSKNCVQKKMEARQSSAECVGP